VRSERVTADASGTLSFDIDALRADVALALGPAGASDSRE
jgi:hypothetical protein